MQAKKNIAARAAQWSSTHRKLAIWGWLAVVVVLVGVFLGGELIERKDISTVDTFSGESQQAERALTDAGLRPTEEVLLIQSKSASAGDPEFQAIVERSADELRQTAHVENVATPSEGGGAISDDKHSVLIDFEIAGPEKDVAENVEASEATVAALNRGDPGFSVEQFGAGSSEGALEDAFSSDLGKAGMISLPLTLLLLVIALGALVAAGVPLILALTGVLATMAMVVIPSLLFPLDGNIDALILLIGLAVGVDYSLFYMRREREERASGKNPRDSLIAAAATSGRAVMISGITVMIAMSGMFLTGEATFESFAVATVVVVAVEMFVSLLVLPAVLAWLGDRVEKGRLPFLGKRRERGGGAGVWRRVVTAVTRRPLVSAVASAGILIALAIPALSMETTQTSVDDMPQNLPVMKTYDRFTEAFPDKANVNEVVVEAGDVRSGEGAAVVDRVVTGAEGSETFIGTPDVTYSDDGTVANVAVPSEGNGTDDASIAALDELRDVVVPAALAGTTEVEANVTGGAAATEDFAQVISERLPLVIAFVLGLAFLLMLFTFRSIVVPIKAIILNLLSVGAAYGVLVMAFQWGWAESLLGFESNGGVTNWLPVFLFVILFGLSMDYHVFILSRVRELYDRGMSTDEAVREGISQTAGTVTSAAAVMIAVFSVFATLSFLDFKEMGVGLAVAVLIDATIIRGVLLPATMKLLGERNWYLPGFLERMPQLHERRPVEVGVEPEPART
ncbi:MAG TPA: MMPL family transporter [Solirubrobacterales bacterium]|nr:MMPL family transporter [Solirubrobacterales bacterium]